MEREVRYCTTEDGVRIAYCQAGEGPPLVYVQGFIESFSQEHLLPNTQDFFRRVARTFRLVRFDMRGTGLSQREVADVSHGALMRDLEAVVRAAGLKRFSLWGPVGGGPRAIAYAALNPDQVDRLILWRTFARMLDVYSREIMEGLIQLCRANWAFGASTFANMGAGEEFPEANSPVADWYERSTTGDMLARTLEKALDWDVTALLPKVQAPTLVISFRQDVLFPTGVALGQQLAAAIPDSRFLTLQTSEPFFSGDARPVLNAINAFLKEGAEESDLLESPEARNPGGLRTILFTDLVDHTEMMTRLGDKAGRAVLREHEAITREVLKAHGGTEIKTMGDGFMASFGSVTRAVECAVALQRGFAEREGEPLMVRVGLNAGEPIEEDGDLFGATVILASRIAAKAESGEILVADTVRGLCSGKGFLFADRGDFVAKGFEEPVRVSEVRWRDG
jgi:class 3 adenylate cyclase/pimeloyl-ACP methyl ester carboxylesterase